MKKTIDIFALFVLVQLYGKFVEPECREVSIPSLHASVNTKGAHLYPSLYSPPRETANQRSPELRLQSADLLTRKTRQRVRNALAGACKSFSGEVS